ncbi:MAG: type II secretion system protein [Planctomycetes bacterium]|nr:type II secretion system protein [Planctomycetota bacterium]
MPRPPARRSPRGFTLIELLTVVAIISLLISILMPSLTRARDQAKSVHCLARMKEFGNALASYENIYRDLLPPAHWNKADPAAPDDPDAVLSTYGWAETMFEFVYKENVLVPQAFPVLRNIEGHKWEEYFLCKASPDMGVSSGHYRVYLPAWAAGTYTIEEDGTFGDDNHPDPWRSASRGHIRPKMPLMGDSNSQSVRGSPCDDPGAMTSYIDAGEANEAGPAGIDGNRFSDRHYGGTNFLFQDLHAAYDQKLRNQLAIDWDLNGVDDIEIVP